MSAEAIPEAAAIPPPSAESMADKPELPATVETEAKEVANGTALNGTAANGTDPSEEVAKPDDAPSLENAVDKEPASDKQTTSPTVAQELPVPDQEDTEMKKATNDDDAANISSAAPVVDESAAPAVNTPASAKGKGRRKSTGIPEHKSKKLNKKTSIAKMNHIDAKPGDYFYVRLKGYPLWPAIIADDTMLPEVLLKSRPVTAMKEDGTYRTGYEDGGPKAKDRTFPVMYLHTNEFGWIPNYDLVDLDFEEVGNVPSSGMRKDLMAARILAAEQNDLDYFKDILAAHEASREADRKMKEAAKEERRAKKAAAKKEKKSSVVVSEGEDEDVEMADVDAIGEPDSEEPEASVKPAKQKKRKAEDTPRGSDSVKKARPTTIKLTTTPKPANGVSTPKSAKESSSKSAKPKTKKEKAPKTPATPEVAVPDEPELTAEQKAAKKEKEILFLRHKLQKGLLNKDAPPKEEEMKTMSEFVSKLEGYEDLEVSIIRNTKINKVLKAILKLSTIPKEEEYKFKPRSQTLLDKWNQLLAAAPSTTNGATSEVKAGSEDAKPSPTEANGTKESPAEEKIEESAEAKTDEAVKEQKPTINETVVESEAAPEASVEEETKKETIAESTTVESAA